MFGAPTPRIVMMEYERHCAELYAEAERDRQLLLHEFDAEDHRRWTSLSALLMIVAVVALALVMTRAVT
jgi:hypothetical protein